MRPVPVPILVNLVAVFFVRNLLQILDQRRKRLIELRQSEPALKVGSYRPVPAEGDLLVYIREHAGERFLAALNLGHKAQTVVTDPACHGHIAISTHLDREGEKVAGTIELRADEGVLVRLDA